jgi:hypothetical protein
MTMTNPWMSMDGLTMRAVSKKWRLSASVQDSRAWVDEKRSVVTRA